MTAGDMERVVQALEAISNVVALLGEDSRLAAVSAKEMSRHLQAVSEAVAGVLQLVRDTQTVLLEVANLRRDFNAWVDSEASKKSDIRLRLTALERANGQRNY